MPITKETPSSKQLIRAFEAYKESQGEEYMSDKMRAHFTGILNKWKQELMEEVDRTVHHMQDEAANFPDPADRASQEEEFSLELRARDRERKLIKKIDETLQLIEDNEYGWCDSCGVEIGIRRLEARPTATLCIDCKTLAEIRKKQIGSDPERGATAPRFIPGPAPFHPPRHHRSRRPAMSSSARPPARYIGRFAPTPAATALRLADRGPRFYLDARSVGGLVAAHGRHRSATGDARRPADHRRDAAELRLRMGRRHAAPERTSRCVSGRHRTAAG